MKIRELESKFFNEETPIFVVFSVDSHQGGELLNNHMDEKPSFSSTTIFTDKESSFQLYEINPESYQNISQSIILIDTPALKIESIASFNKFFSSQLNNCNVAGFIFLHDYGRINNEGTKLFSRVSSVAEKLNIPLIITLSHSNKTENTAENWIKFLPNWKYNDVILAGGTLARGEILDELSEKAIQRRRDLFNSRFINFLEILNKHALHNQKLLVQNDVFPIEFFINDTQEEAGFQKTILQGTSNLQYNIQIDSTLRKFGMLNHASQEISEKKQEIESSPYKSCIIS